MKDIMEFAYFQYKITDIFIVKSIVMHREEQDDFIT